MSTAAAILLALLPAAQETVPDTAPDGPAVPAELDRAAGREASDRALDYLVRSQHPDGSWGTGTLDSIMEFGFSVESFYAWQVAAHGLVLMALCEAPQTPARDAALAAGLDWLLAARRPKRGSHWDNDMVWSALYGFVALVHLHDDPRFAAAEERERLAAAAQGYLADLLRNQTPDGGWGYYDDPPWTRRPHWATSFCTALVLPALDRAVELGWLEDEAVRDRALQHVQRCALPSGAYEYDLRPVPRIWGGEHINRIKGSLGRIQVCNWARAECGDPVITPERLREGLEAFFEHHRFLDVARLRPIPHEAYYANAGYFYFFGHFYTAAAIDLLPAEEREAWHARLRPHLVKTLRAEGSTSDFHDSSYMVIASTALLTLALEAGLEEPPQE